MFHMLLINTYRKLIAPIIACSIYQKQYKTKPNNTFYNNHSVNLKTMHYIVIKQSMIFISMKIAIYNY